jgi:hypothetical protein
VGEPAATGGSRRGAARKWPDAPLVGRRRIGRCLVEHFPAILAAAHPARPRGRAVPKPFLCPIESAAHRPPIRSRLHRLRSPRIPVEAPGVPLAAAVQRRGVAPSSGEERPHVAEQRARLKENVVVAEHDDWLALRSGVTQEDHSLPVTSNIRVSRCALHRRGFKHLAGATLAYSEYVE